jgi:hypothetical protein
MKNFSTVVTRAAAGALAACALAAPAQAATCTFRANAPDQHLVVKGDTLWDISGTFLEHPWCWPQVWGMNRDQIRNPHWIYPGQIIYFDRLHGRLSLTKPGSSESEPPVTRLSPQVRTEGLDQDAVPSVAAGVIEPFLTQALAIEPDALAGAPRIAASQEGHVNLSKGDKVYVRGDLKGGSSFQVFRPGNALKDPQTGAVLAYEASYLGTVLLQSEARGTDVHRFLITDSKQEIAVGDRLVATPPVQLRSYVPHPPERAVDGRVMSIYGAGLNFAGQNQVVTVNRGSIDGLDVGAVLALYHFGKTVPDPGGSKGFLGLGKSMMKLPDEQYGTLFVFRVFGHVSYGLIMQVTEPVEVGDVVKSPE